MNESSDALVLRISESAADRMLQRIRLASSIETRQQYEFSSLGFSRIKVNLELRESNLRLRRADGGAIRLELFMRGEFSFGFPYPDRRIDLSCAVLARPELRRADDEQLVLSTDFAQASLQDLRVSSRSSGGMLAFDPYALGPFTDDRLIDAAKLTLRAALRRIGLRRGEMTSQVLTRLLGPGSHPGALTIAIDDGEMGVGPAEPGVSVPGSPRERRTPVLESKIESKVEAKLRSKVQEQPASAGDARLWVGETVLTRLASDLVSRRARGSRWCVEAPRVRCRSREIEVDAEILPSGARWPVAWRARVSARLRPQVGASGIELVLLDVGVERISLPRWTRRLLLRALAPRVEQHILRHSFSLRLPPAGDEQWKVEVSRIELRDGRLDLVLDTDL
ncbi:MAG: hypothetical protein JRG96_03180 [Deltaproteobacteria bacterium]|nr:hypothetical protein [Deltaproteobacteria bacterium]MBW2421070.1 hypothetical protein [Deltaproteobacteria bacterium]